MVIITAYSALHLAGPSHDAILNPKSPAWYSSSVAEGRADVQIHKTVPGKQGFVTMVLLVSLLENRDQMVCGFLGMPL